MRLKYYLRGMGIGVIITTIVLAIGMNLTKANELSDQEIKKRAQELGMVMKESGSEQTESDADNIEEKQLTEDSNPPATEEVNSGENVTQLEEVVFTIAPGESSTQVVLHLYEAGLIDNIEAYGDYLEEGNKDSFLQPGQFTIVKGSSYEEVTQRLLTKQEFRE